MNKLTQIKLQAQEGDPVIKSLLPDHQENFKLNKEW